jgi:hypothetical protein
VPGEPTGEPAIILEQQPKATGGYLGTTAEVPGATAEGEPAIILELARTLAA